MIAGNNIVNFFSGHCEVEWVDGWDGSASAVHTSGWEALNVALLIGRASLNAFRIITTLRGDVRERDSPTGNGSDYVCHRAGCGLRRHLDGVASDTPIWDIVDRSGV